VKYELYIDVFFLLNFFMDTLLLFLIRKILKCTATHARLLIGGAFGAGMTCMITVMPMIPVWMKLFAGYGVISICMIKISFPGMHFKSVCRAAVYLYGFAFLLGGVLEFLSVHIPFFRTYRIGILGICMTGIIIYAIVCTVYEKQKQKGSCLFPVKLVWRDKTFVLKALADTGNSLYEPVSGKPVSIVEKKVLEAVFAGGKPEIFRAIPFHSIGTSHGIIEGYEITELIVYEENEKIRIEKPMVGSFDGKLSTKSAYQMILHPTLIKWQEERI
jgi:stage II sporulation protein GA (sporulation sigma-E factor processing peptidase)